MSIRDAVATMGSILPDDVGGRDAVHVAVIAVEAATRLYPSQDVGIVFEGDRKDFPKATVGPLANDKATHVGIVDPFLKHPVSIGERFWLYLYPRTISGLNHHWSHTLIDSLETNAKQKLVELAALTDKLEGKEWLKNWFKHYGHGGSFDEFIRSVKYAIETHSDYVNIDGYDASGEIPSEIWPHVEKMLGCKITQPPEYYSCSC